MSGSVEGDVIVTVVGGVLYLGYLAAKGTVWTAGKLIQGTATIVGDTMRGRRVRLAGENAGELLRGAGSAVNQHTRQRREIYERQLHALPTEPQQVLQDLHEQSRQQEGEFQQALQELRQRHTQYIDRRCEQIDEDLRLAQERFEDHSERLAQSIDERFRDERQHVLSELARQSDIFQNALEEQRAGLQSQLDRINQRIDDERGMAEDWLAAAEAEIAFVRSQYRHDFFCPGELGAIDQRLSMARQNVQQDVCQAALAVAQECVLQATLLHQELELRTQQWETHRLLALQSLEVGIEALQAHRSFQLSEVAVQGTGPCRTAPATEVETDYWTHGAWSALHQRLGEMRWGIADTDANVSLHELQRIQEAGHEAITQAVALAATAKYALMASILRVDLQREFAARLADSGYEVVDNAWAGNDERQANHVLLRGVNGDEIAVVIAPKEDAGQLSNRIQVHFRDVSPSEAERKEKLEAIHHVLNEVYQLPRETLDLRCMPGTDWQDNASGEHFELDQIRGEASRNVAQPGTDGV